MNLEQYDVIVLGGGPGGSTLASLLAKRGIQVALVEKEEFPRFQIGESLLPHSMDVLKKSGVFDTINDGRYIRKYGATFVDYREPHPLYFEFAKGLDQNHPYAFEVPRDQFDKDLLDHAQNLGVDIFQPEKAIKVEMDENSVIVHTNKRQIGGKFVADATGRKALLSSYMECREKFPQFANNAALFAHYRHVKRSLQKQEGDFILGVLPDNCWSWHIPFLGDRTSVGVVGPARKISELHKSPEGLTAIINESPLFKTIMMEAEPITEPQILANYSYYSSKKINDRCILLGDAASFLDPVFSSGVHLSLMSAELASIVLEEALSKKVSSLLKTPPGETYERDFNKGVERFQSLLLLFYNTPFTDYMKKVVEKPLLYKSFTSLFSGDMWNDQNCLFRLDVLNGAINENTSL